MNNIRISGFICPANGDLDEEKMEEELFNLRERIAKVIEESGFEIKFYTLHVVDED